MNTAGRLCPLRYRYGAGAIAQAPETHADTLYVIGGLYGNRPALAALEALVAAETGPVRRCFNGDFNWFNVDHAGFRAVNTAVLAHDAILGNVEAELQPDADDAGCGCAYPDGVSDAVVARSNHIHARLKATAAAHPDILARLDTLAMFARYRVGEVRVGVVHGDADALAGWRFDAGQLDLPDARAALLRDFDAAGVDLFASSHTCLPACRQLAPGRVLINNGAAGLPNFRGQPAGVITRIATTPAPVAPLYGLRLAGVHVDALALPYAQDDWLAAFLANWPPGSPAHDNYFERITGGPAYAPAQAAPG
jgi:hypothetical protein